ncbi:MAG: hypothetical protein M3N10_07160 [Actinomycetota bacterium]|nr:hypothetical protein [Actinomycetota bacterium]
MALPTTFGDIAGLILSLVCYFAAMVFAIFVFSFASTGFEKHPELKVLLPSFMGREDAWQGMFGAATFFAIAAAPTGQLSRRWERWVLSRLPLK